MTSNPDFHQRLNRLENDATATYEMIGDIQAVQELHSAEFARIRTKLIEHDTRFNAVDARFDTVDARFDAMDARFDTVETTLAEILRRLPEAS